MLYKYGKRNFTHLKQNYSNVSNSKYNWNFIKISNDTNLKEEEDNICFCWMVFSSSQNLADFFRHSFIWQKKFKDNKNKLFNKNIFEENIKLFVNNLQWKFKNLTVVKLNNKVIYSVGNYNKFHKGTFYCLSSYYIYKYICIYIYMYII